MNNLDKYIYIYVKFVMIVAAVNTALGVMGNEYNLLLRLLQQPKWLRWFYILVGVGAVWVASKRETYLPFLGECALPSTVFKSGSNIPSTADKLVTMKVAAAGAEKIVWWASKPAAVGQTQVAGVYSAYDDYMNSGVADVINGEATIAFMCPQPYTVGFNKKVLKRHVHYREILKGGMIGKIHTMYVQC
jgi:uncharacterized membrane protein YuzA (DUF378 family)